MKFVSSINRRVFIATVLACLFGRKSIMSHSSESLKIGSWQSLLGGRGDKLTINKNYIAAAELARLTVWSEDNLIAQIESPLPTPSYPRFTATHLRWGEVILSLETGLYERIEDLYAALVYETEAPIIPSPRGGYRPSIYAWAPDGDALVVAATWTGATGPPPARVILTQESGEYQNTLWQGSDFAPKAIWVGHSLIVVGNRNPLVLNRDGSIVKTLTANTPAFRIEASADESRLLVAEYGQLTIWDTHTWTTIGKLAGTWLDAAIFPDGQFVMAVDFENKIQVICVSNRLSKEEVITFPGQQIRNVAVDLNQVAVSCTPDPAIRVAELHINSTCYGSSS